MAVPGIVGDNGDKVTCPESLQRSIVTRFEQLRRERGSVAHCNAFLTAMPFMTVDRGTIGAIMVHLKSLIEARLHSHFDDDPRTLFAFGAGLRTHGQLDVVESGTSQIWPAVYEAVAYFGTLSPYLEAVLTSLKTHSVTEASNALDPLIDSIAENLHSSSHDLRRLSLQILDALHSHIYHQRADILATALMIENNPLTLESARAGSMHVRKLSVQYRSIAPDNWLLKVIPHFCFGLLTFKLSQLGSDAIEVLRVISGAQPGEGAITTLAFQWLDGTPSCGEDPSLLPNESRKRKASGAFQCSNLSEVEAMMSAHAIELKNASQAVSEKFTVDHRVLSHVPANAPSLALKILLGNPHIAEKNSRHLVPIFLRWAAGESEDSVEVIGSEEETVQALHDSSESPRLAWKDRKAMLDLFGHFINPKVLYRASEVYKALLDLLASGDVTIQKSALQAILAWKTPSLIAYQENLLNLLDDARFREEVAIFVNVDQRDSTIQDEHRQILMPVLLRILYGKVTARSGPTGRRGQSIKRKAVLEAIARFEPQDLDEFINIALGPLACATVIDQGELALNAIDHEYLDTRKQVGLVNMMKSMLETIGDRLKPLMKKLMDALLYCLIKAARVLTRDQQEFGAYDGSGQLKTSMLKDIRQQGLQCLTLIFKHCMLQDYEQYLPVIFNELINPRMEKLAIETSQSVSSLMQLFSMWASSETTVTLFSDYNPMILESVVACLDVESAKDDVKLFVLDEILKRIIESSIVSSKVDYDQQKSSKVTVRVVLGPHLDYILKAVGSLLHKSPAREVLESAVHLVASIAPLVEGSLETRNLLEISSFLLDQPSNRVKPKSKGDLLQVVEHFAPLLDYQTARALQDRLFNTISSLFGFFHDRVNRQSLARILNVLAERDVELQGITKLCTDLNAFSTQKVDEPDFEARLRAFSNINEDQYRFLSPKQWCPIVYNMLFYIRDREELAIRASASYTLRRFVEVNKVPTVGRDDTKLEVVRTILIPALRKGILDPSELVRAEYLSVMAELIRCNPDWEEINDMSALLCNDDEEASFFLNILHIQQHRRLRALRRLATEAGKGGLRSTNVAHFFIPLVEHFIFDKAEDESAHNLSAEAVTTIGNLAQSLEWPQFRAMFRRFTAYIHSKPDLEKTVIKLLGVIIDALNRAAITKGSQSPHDELGGMDSVQQPTEDVLTTLAATMPRQDRFTDDLVNNLLPPLNKYLHDKNESTVSLRVPVAVSIVKLLQLLPGAMLKDYLPLVLTDVCNILRSRTQESRDLTRKTLVEISTLIGPSCFGFILRELRTSLAKGYQLHVLSFTVHAILVATTNIYKPGELDYCLPQILSVIMDDIFGATGQEKDAEEYISKMKEVKSSKSCDSMELIAKVTSIDSFVHLIAPLQTLLQERLDLRIVKKIDELLRRLGVGLLRNEKVNDRRVLVFCHEIIRETYKTGKEENVSKEDYRVRRFLINMNGANKYGSRGSTSSYGYKLARFALDLLRSLLHRYEGLQTPSNIHGFMPIIGDSIVQSNEEIQVSALRLLATIMKTPLKEIDENAGVYISECVKIVKGSTTMSSELAQAALKLVSSILRERHRIEVREPDLAYLLKRLIPDLNEPDRQGVAFNFLKAILTRKVVIPEVYEVFDIVAAMMVTNQTKGTRDVARSIYFQFIQDYPQAKGRFSKQIAFLVRNLEYKHQEGRQSVMEAIHLFLSKIGDDLVQDILSTFFVPLVMVMVNDQSAECREMAGTLLKTVFDKADSDRKRSFLVMLRSWLGQSDQLLLVRVALQVYCIFLDSAGAKGEKELSILQPRLLEIFKNSVKDSADSDWEVLYFALQAFLKVCQAYPTIAFSATNAPTWVAIRHCLAFPHVWVKLSGAKVLGTLFADFARANAGSEGARLPLKGSGGLYLTAEEMIAIARISLRSLRVSSSNEALASQSVRNLVFLGRNFGDTSIGNGNDHPEAKRENLNSEEEEESPSPETRKTALQFIFERVSAIIRRGPVTTKAQALTPIKAALQLVGALCNHLHESLLASSIETILLPLHNLTDPSIPTPFSSDEAFNTSYKALVANSTEIMTLLQRKLGTTKYIANLAKVREGVKDRREGRRVKRRIEVVAEPERAGVLKQRKGEKKREKRKERSGGERGRRRGW